MRIHADVEIEHDEDRRLQPLGEIEGARAANSNASAGPSGMQQHMLGVAVRGEGAGEEVRLLRAGRHAGRGAAALHVEDDDRNFGEIGEAEEFLHQRDARPGRRREGARAVPAGADRDADRGDLVLRLDDRVVLLARRLVDAEARAVALERFGERGRGRDRIPGANRRPAIDRAEPGGEIAFDQDAVADRVAARTRTPSGQSKRGVRLGVADAERLEVGGEAACPCP